MWCLPPPDNFIMPLSQHWEGKQWAFSAASSPSSITICNLHSFHFLLHLFLLCTMQKVLFVLSDRVSCWICPIAKPYSRFVSQCGLPSLSLCTLSAAFLSSTLWLMCFILQLGVIYYWGLFFGFFGCRGFFLGVFLLFGLVYFLSLGNLILICFLDVLSPLLQTQCI